MGHLKVRVPRAVKRLKTQRTYLDDEQVRSLVNGLSRVEGHVGMRWGIIGRYRSLVPYRKVQAVALRAGPIERILGLATLTVYVAGGSPTVMANLPRDEAAELQRDLAVEATAAKFVW